MTLTFACFHLPAPNAGTARTYWAFFAMMATSVRKVAPDAEIHLLTHTEAQVPDGLPATQIFRRRAGETIKESFTHLMRAETETWRDYARSDLLRGPTVFMDVDILLQRSPAELFDGGFDIALTYAKDTSLHPFNAGVILIDPTRRMAVQRFFDTLDADVAALDADHQEWYGDQIALARAVGEDAAMWEGTVDRTLDDLRLRAFSADEWNASLPLDESNRPVFTRIPRAGAVHFKGERKGLMLRYASEVLGITATEDASAPGGWRFTV